MLLNSEIDRGGHVEAETKLIHLEDEIVYCYRTWAQDHSSAVPSLDGSAANVSSVDGEARIRADVRRIVRTEDPVFKVLMKRAVEAIGKRIFLHRNASAERSITGPLLLRTGRGGYLHTKDDARDIRAEGTATDRTFPRIQGLEDPTLVKALNEITHEVEDACRWAESVWDDIL